MYYHGGYAPGYPSPQVQPPLQQQQQPPQQQQQREDCVVHVHPNMECVFLSSFIIIHAASLVAKELPLLFCTNVCSRSVGR